MVTEAGASTWQILLRRQGRLWQIIAAPIGSVTEGVNPLMTEKFHTAKEARQAADRFFPALAWVNSKKGYVKVTPE